MNWSRSLCQRPTGTCVGVMSQEGSLAYQEGVFYTVAHTRVCGVVLGGSGLAVTQVFCRMKESRSRNRMRTPRVVLEKRDEGRQNIPTEINRDEA